MCIPDAQLHVGEYGSVRDFQCICWVGIIITHGEAAFVIASLTGLTESHLPCEAWCESQVQSGEGLDQHRRLVKGGWWQGLSFQAACLLWKSSGSCVLLPWSLISNNSYPVSQNEGWRKTKQLSLWGNIKVDKISFVLAAKYLMLSC